MIRQPPTQTEKTRDIVHQIARQCDVAPDMIEDAYPCTAFQAGTFKAGTQLAGVLHYNLVFKVEDITPQMTNRICEAFESVHCRHPILRSRIVQYKDYRNANTPRIAQALIKEDFEWLSFDDLDQYCQERTGHCLRYGEQLVQYGISKDKKHLVWTIHHAVYDGWSMGIIWKELCDMVSVEGYLQRVLVQRPKYVKFIAHLQKPMAESDKRYWAAHLAHYTGPRLNRHELVPTTNMHRNGILELADARESPITATARIQAAWFCTLVELYGNLDVMTLTASTGRNSQIEDIADICGPCVCAVPFRKRVNLMEPLYQFMRDVEKCSGELLAHEHTGMECLETLVEEAQRPNHTFNLKSGLEGVFTGIQGLEMQPVRGFKKISDWFVAVAIGEKKMRWELYFDSERLDQSAVELICERFPVLIQACQTLESHESVILKDVIDMRRLSCEL